MWGSHFGTVPQNARHWFTIWPNISTPRNIAKRNENLWACKNLCLIDQSNIIHNSIYTTHIYMLTHPSNHMYDPCVHTNICMYNHTCTGAHTHNAQVCTLNMITHAYMDMWSYLGMCPHTHMHIHNHRCPQTYVVIPVHVCVHMHTYTFIYIQSHVHLCVYTL